ncbi:membrane dipeptidase [Xenorhabdus bovienii]|uniref:dipeptidase n=1 Tax=Xenorhabdus bovienii TaxID=40576 RepID=UPI0023B2191A|nr:membrane dipeptidase [Xenorhabdus bovienii]MDE9492789.1 membrane dipeptidase [Xenorhabdus bovienii]MDE9500684.1 membrane dipeptidase [Xenorhabdus bovienii]MDE9524845.1 membrane dipeptidase [Xenorhabdus bovienii]MDE9568167.1 membrane dipeptidase [Xenorhabdus bovienii]
MTRRKKIILTGGGVIGACALIFFFVLPRLVETRMNRVIGVADVATQTAVDLHKRLQIADLHADTLLWGRDLLDRSTRGQVDIPRLIDGNVAVQVFAVVSKSPRGLNIEKNSAETDNVTLLALAQRWPWRTLFSLKERALYQAARLHEAAARSNGKLVVIKSRADLKSFLERRRSDPKIVGALLASEGAQVLEGDPANVDVLFEAGYRMMAPTHFFDTELGGSAHGIEKGGLTAAGADMVRRMEAKSMIIDLAHASTRTIDDILAIATRPVVVSHTGVKGTCDNIRNLSDDQLRRIAAMGGLIGIGFWDKAVCDPTPASIAKAQIYAANIAGDDHVALGSDFDGAVEMPFDATGLVSVTDALLKNGVQPERIAKLMGENQIRFLLENLP